jgi:riboflavin synthase
MFTGIIEAVGEVKALERRSGGCRLTVAAPDVASATPPGASVAVSGVCLTVVGVDAPFLTFDVIPETLDRSTLGELRPGGRVNLERSLRAGDRMDGHFVQGHVDGTARVARVVRGEEHVVWLRPGAGLLPCIVPKGSIAVDGVSLTIARAAGEEFSVAMIPTTLSATTLGALREGVSVNIETDILARIVVHALRAGRERAPLTVESLHAAGFS